MNPRTAAIAAALVTLLCVRMSGWHGAGSMVARGQASASPAVPMPAQPAVSTNTSGQRVVAGRVCFLGGR